MADKNQLKSILENIQLSGQLKEDELEAFSIDEKQLIINLYKDGLVKQALELLDDMDVDIEWSFLKHNISKKPAKVVPIWKKVIRYAAITVGAGLALYYIVDSENIDLESPDMKGTITLKSSNGEVDILRDNDQHQIMSANGAVVGEQSGNTLSYKTGVEIKNLVYNELEIPYGKLFNLELSDGTLVHLNSGTKIKYPVKFLKGINREVFIEGEAYFEVSKDKNRPFVVHANEVAVEVLGTEFNVSSYKEDNEIKTVLIEGSVSISNSIQKTNKTILHPGQKGTWNRTEKSTEIEEVDVNIYTGWIKGELVFRNESFENMIRKLERKYVVDIENNNILLAEKKFNARFNVNIETINDVFKSISELYKFEYKITDDKVTVY